MGADVWLNTVETAELIKLKLDSIFFESSISLANITYYHLPILDDSIPSEAEDRRWREFMSPALIRHLQKGEKILLHCRAGLGRTGMIAARLLVDVDCAP